jgi:hypothetical protein
MSARSLFPISDNPDRDQDAPRLNQTVGGSNDLPPQPLEQIGRRNHPACNATADIQDIHDLTSLLHLIDHQLGIIPGIASAYGKERRYPGT